MPAILQLMAGKDQLVSFIYGQLKCVCVCCSHGEGWILKCQLHCSADFMISADTVDNHV